MHFSGMRTARLLIVSQHALPGGEVPVLGGGYLTAQGGSPARGVCASQHAMGQTHTPVDRQTTV